MITTINNAIAKKREDGEKGFTLIELLVVILIIGVLAAIAIPAFLNQREGAWASQVESDLKNAAIAAEQYAVDNNGSYAGLSLAELDTFGYNVTDDVNLTVTSATASDYVLGATHDQRGTDAWSYSSTTGIITSP
jgi:type IV pilus assembly protein PilA